VIGIDRDQGAIARGADLSGKQGRSGGRGRFAICNRSCPGSADGMYSISACRRCSSTAERGTFRLDGPLNMRMGARVERRHVARASRDLAVTAA
jgi:hypothetical protein